MRGVLLPQAGSEGENRQALKMRWQGFLESGPFIWRQKPDAPLGLLHAREFRFGLDPTLGERQTQDGAHEIGVTVVGARIGGACRYGALDGLSGQFREGSLWHLEHLQAVFVFVAPRTSFKPFLGRVRPGVATVEAALPELGAEFVVQSVRFRFFPVASRASNSASLMDEIHPPDAAPLV